ncbi:amino acid adenylation domain-containing protein [Streptomyces sp. NPDC001941]|uniref:non-ribosomal peptide synthetase n=1 Tax=Streptomyces sp. NPDC001941 TaxID=3154659 RepID=UPI003316FA3D
MDEHEVYEFPVSEAQSRLLVLAQLDPGGAQYHVPAAFRVSGPLDPAALGRALDALVARHEALRTVFRTGADGTPVQLVAARGRAGLRVLRDVPAGAADGLLREEAARPFDPARGPLLRCVLLALDDGSHRLLLVAHHLVCDGWSLGVLLRDLERAYAAELTGTPWDAPELPLQFPDFAAWQRERLAAGGYAAAVAHWAGELRGAPETAALPLDRPRPAVLSAAGGTVRFPLGAGVRERLAALAREAGTTPFTVLFAAYAVLVARLTGREDLVIGFPVSGRDRPELQELAGMLTNTLALRLDLSGDPSFGALVARVRDRVAAGRPHQDAPFEAVVDAVAPVRDTSHDPLVQVVFGYDDDTDLGLRLAGARVEPCELTLDTAKFDLHLQVERRGGELAAQLIFRRDLFDAETVRRWVPAFRTLLDALLGAPGAPVSRAEAVPADERARTLADADRTALAAPVDRLVPRLVADRAAERPDATALVCGAVSLTYRELLGRADRLAHRLRAAGVGPGVRVALLLSRSPALGVAALAVLRAGGAFVPLDRAHPPARLAYMVGNAGAGLLLADAVTAPAALGLGAQVLRADEDDPSGPRAEPVAVRPGDLAYVLYTSGSTGVPKGVAVEHRALANLAVAVRPEFPVGPDDRVLQYVSTGFDVAVSDLFFPWVAGAELHLAGDDERLGDALLARLRESRITYVFLPPSAGMSLPPGDLPHLRTLAVGGEACPPEFVERLSAPGRRIVDAYGPAEATVYSTTAVLRPGRPVVIGRPVPGSRAYVLDARLRPVPCGVTGEIYLAGATLARGYTGQPAMTAERFVADPHGPAGTRMYRTGDLGRFDAEGVLHYLGRADTQVKVRGIRIELGEVETLLAAHPAVRHAAAAVREGRLVAYAVGADVADEVLRAHLAERLPGYMVPEAFVRLPELPLNRSGKLERSRLPDPPAERPRLDQEFTAPRPGTEEAVAGAWARVLTVDRVGAHDNFFDLGGNSVRLLAVLGALRERFGLGEDRLTLVDLFRRPTVAALAAHLDGPAPAPGAATDTGAEAARRGAERRRRAAAAHQLRSRKGTAR